MKLLKFTVLFSLLAFYSAMAMGQIEIKGRVTSDDEPNGIIGANVIIKGTQLGAITDGEGNFSIKVNSPSDVLVISFIGYLNEEIVVGNQTLINAKLVPDIQSLGEVVVMGYSEKKKNEIASAVTVISADKLKSVTSNDLGNLLQGKVSGVQVVNNSGAPGSKASIRIRGLSTISGSSDPLYVVDGVVSGNSDPGIDPNSIENITILKDAGATGMYGSRANAGVIIITTKNGSSAKTHFEANLVSGLKLVDFGNIRMMNGQEYYEAHKLLFLKSNGLPDMTRFEKSYPEELASRNFDWVNEGFSPAYYNSLNMSASGKTDKYKYYIGATYTSDEGTFMNTKYNEFSIRSNNNYSFSERVNFTANVDLKVNKTLSTASTDDLMYLFLASPWDSAYDANGNVKYVDKTTTPWYFREPFNPIHNIKNQKNSSLGANMGIQSALNIKIFSFLTFSTSVSGSVNGYKASQIKYPAISGQYHGTGSYYRYLSDGFGGLMTNLLKLNKDFGEHSFSGLVGCEFNYYKSDFTGINTTNLPYGSSSIEGTAYTGTPTGYEEESAMNSFISQLNYSFRGKYFLTASYRIDENSKFAPNKKTASFPTVSVSWLMNKEDFMNGMSAIKLLKSRFSFGYTGSDNISCSKYQSLYNVGTTALGETGIFPSQAQNFDLTWETTRQLDFGIEANLYDRIDLVVDLYSNLTDNLIFPVRQDYSTGFETRWENGGKVENRGIEITLGTVNFKTDNLTWRTELNISFNQNEVKSGKELSRTREEREVVVKQGYALFSYNLPVWAGVDEETGQPLWQQVTTDAKGNVVPLKDANGNIQTTSIYDVSLAQLVDDPLPTYQGGFSTQLMYKNLTLAASLVFSGGNKVYNNNMEIFDTDGNEPKNNWMVPDESWTRWTKAGDKADLPLMGSNANSYKPSTRYLEDGDYMKLRNISLSYNLPDHWLKDKVKASFTLSCDNVYTWFKAHSFDPEASVRNDGYFLPGELYFDYPKSRQFNIALNLKF